MIEKTLIVLKPDALQRGVTGEIISRFEKIGLKMVAAKIVEPDEEFYYHHYENIGKMVSRRGQKAFDFTLAMMQNGPVLAIILEGVEAVKVVRKMVGTTEPKEALPGTIRGDFAHTSFAYSDSKNKGTSNLIHASGDIEDAKAEIEHWFKPEEIYDYSAVHEKHTR
ncbi:nucleoside-diphosphate kinase [bacterium (Candidatus Howlettbacteria) CG_4_10_14_0_8_um_filter_40_9]|nr:MAG: nucleoside-diphosphate kinase [bacterium (Candidatus Howlettbacteria) CG_4_10_14_0_8_um_filter_40_9]